MSPHDPYNETVRQRFAHPAYAGDVAKPTGRLVTADIVGAGESVRIRLAADVTDGRISTLRFRARGCPHLIAALDDICERAPGMEVCNIKDLVTRDLVRELGIPRDKTGTVFLVEDAIDTLIMHYERSLD